MPFGDVPGDGEAEPGPTGAGRPGVVEPGEPLENPLSLLPRDTRTVIGHDHLGMAVPGLADGHDDLRAGVADGVLEQVGHGPLELGAIPGLTPPVVQALIARCLPALRASAHRTGVSGSTIFCRPADHLERL